MQHLFPDELLYTVNTRNEPDDTGSSSIPAIAYVPLNTSASFSQGWEDGWEIPLPVKKTHLNLSSGK